MRSGVGQNCVINNSSRKYLPQVFTYGKFVWQITVFEVHTSHVSISHHRVLKRSRFGVLVTTHVHLLGTVQSEEERPLAPCDPTQHLFGGVDFLTFLPLSVGTGGIGSVDGGEQGVGQQHVHNGLLIIRMSQVDQTATNQVRLKGKKEII